MFLSRFYCYLNHHPTNDYVIDLDKVWDWMGFKCKYTAKRLLEKCFVINKDYIKSLPQPQEQTIHVKGGHNKEIFMLNVKKRLNRCV